LIVFYKTEWFVTHLVPDTISIQEQFDFVYVARMI
jgi:hypothetical protein